jgi:hypothetical protein
MVGADRGLALAGSGDVRHDAEYCPTRLARKAAVPVLGWRIELLM